MKHAQLIIFCVLSLFITSCGTAEKPITRADLHPSPGTAHYDPVKNMTTFENGGYSWAVKGNMTNAMMYPEGSPMPMPASRFESLYQTRDSQKAMTVEYLGQLDGYAYLRVKSNSANNSKQPSGQIIYCELAKLDQTFRDALPPNPPGLK